MYVHMYIKQTDLFSTAVAHGVECKSIPCSISGHRVPDSLLHTESAISKQLRIQCNHKIIINIPERAAWSLVYIALLVEEDHLIYGFHQCSNTDQKIVGTMILLAAFMLDRVK